MIISTTNDIDILKYIRENLTEKQKEELKINGYVLYPNIFGVIEEAKSIEGLIEYIPDSYIIFEDDLDLESEYYKKIKDFHNLKRLELGILKREQQKGFKRKIVRSQSDINIRSIKDGVITQSSVIDKTNKIIYAFENCLIENFIVSYGEIAGFTLFLSNFQGVKYTEEEEKRLRAKRSPAYAKAGIFDDMVMIDLKSAYYQILEKIKIDCYYNGIKFKRGYKNPNKLVESNKIIRNAIIGILYKDTTRVIENGKIKTKKRKQVNYGVWGFIQDFLNHITETAVKEFNCIYSNVDNYIIPNKNKKEFLSFLDSIGVKYEIQAEGLAIIKALGVYKIGDYKTKNFDRYKDTFRDIDKIENQTLEKAEYLIEVFKGNITEFEYVEKAVDTEEELTDFIASIL